MSHPPVTLANTQVWERRAAANGIRYRVSLWVPPGEPPAGGWPVIYVLDANALFATFVEALRRGSYRPQATGIETAAVVGIAHAGRALYVPERRYRDYTFGPSALAPASRTVGGGEAFLAFLVDELIPELHEAWALNGSRRMLFGHSLAGYFTLHALMARPEAFRTYAAISPSIWWDEAGLRARMPGMAGHAARVFMAVGEWEGEGAPGERREPGHSRTLQRRRERRMVERAQTLARDLETLLGEQRVAFRNFPEEDHASVLMVAIPRTLRFVMAADGVDDPAHRSARRGGRQ
ncbi:MULTISPECIES: alpha/beta hydrolase-fold protein [unclassified Modicisalibacter]|uniref:alpha/beta hydrolase n=1 Tax=unclassified Modicisalibacter TaxID=2679913 RepID=UPI001CCFCA5B|nr:MULTISPECIES: alpha/beta hydrolase-fold protein [unclassified Modicisalibacter]MBZ9557446.1 alpha/beta hydrolase [Modicisalibacter sp. R2A 31.J]MBZ9573888.1 alpha/beta hydrolase [Modicisalibacter sp. MOD 31.J]